MIWRRRNENVPLALRGLGKLEEVTLPNGTTLWIGHRPSRDLPAAYEKATEKLTGTGWRPVLLGPEKPGVHHFGEAVSDEELEEALARDVPTWLEEHHLGEMAEEDEELSLPRPEEIADVELSEESLYSAVIAEDGYLGYIEAEHSWELPYRLGWMGPVNYDLSPVDHAPVLRRWQERYGAEVYALTTDTLELQIENPPRTLEKAKEFACEIYGYCPDSVDQGTGTLEELTAEIGNSRHVVLWWD